MKITRPISVGLALVGAAVLMTGAAGQASAGGGDDHHARLQGCYFRADVGYAFGSNGEPRGSTPGATYGRVTQSDFDSDTFFGEVGVGCARAREEHVGGSVKDAPAPSVHGLGIRADFTVGFRGEQDFRGNPPTPPAVIDPVRTSFSTITTMFNVYVDIGTHRGFTPYLGAGIGAAFHDKDDAVFTNGGVVRVRGDRDTELAWALMAGVATDLGRGMKLDIGYRYIDLGELSWRGTTGHTLKLEDLSAHEIRIGVRVPMAW